MKNKNRGFRTNLTSARAVHCIMFNLGMLTLKEDLKKKRFYKAYGKHVLLIEIALILTLTFTFAILCLTFSSYLLVPWLIVVFVSILIHLRIFYRIANLELCPYEILRLGRFRFYFFIMIVFSFFLSLTLLYSLSSFLTKTFFVVVVILLNYFLLVNFPMLFIALMLKMASITNHKKARLSFKIVIDAMELLRKEKKTDEKMKLIDKYVKWFGVGLRSYNSYLYENNPACLEIVDIEQYHRSVCNVALMGKRTEIDNTIEQIKSVLNCVSKREREDDLRHFLIALKNVKSGKRKKEYPLFELNEMTRISPFSERIKEKLKSPYATLLIGIVAIVLQVLRLIWK